MKSFRNNNTSKKNGRFLIETKLIILFSCCGNAIAINKHNHIVIIIYFNERIMVLETINISNRYYIPGSHQLNTSNNN